MGSARTGGTRRGWGVPVVVLWTVLCVPRAFAQPVSEYEVKAAFLYNFAKFVEWPEKAEPGAPIQLCVVGENPFGPGLATAVAGRKIQGRELAVRSAQPGKDLLRCDIVFISRSEEGRLEALLTPLASRPVLTVSDIGEFADRGGIIGLKMEEQKVRFEVNVVAARRAGLKLSSQLLKVAVQVIGQFEGEP